MAIRSHGQTAGTPAASPPGGAGNGTVPDRPPQGRFYRHPLRHRFESLRFSGPDPHRRHQPEACSAGADGQPVGGRAGAAAGRRSVGAGPRTAGLRAQPDLHGTGVHHLLRGGKVYEIRKNHFN